MKSTRKLLISSLLLVLAFVAVVSSTYAWFTMQANPEIEGFDIDVTAGEGLRMSIKDKDGTYKSIWTKDEFMDFYGDDLLGISLDTITPMFDGENLIANQFEVPNFHPAKQETDKDGNIIGESAPFYSLVPVTNEKAYFTFDLWFESDRVVDVYLDSGIVRNAKQDQTSDAINSARIAFISYKTEDSNEVPDIFRIYNPRPGSSAIGVGNFFEPKHVEDNFIYMRNEGTEGEGDEQRNYPALLQLDSTKEKYEMVDQARLTANTDKTFSSVGVHENTNLFRVNGGEHKVQLTVHIWLEGWDGDATDAAKNAVINVFLRFIGQAVDTEPGN